MWNMAETIRKTEPGEKNKISFIIASNLLRTREMADWQNF